MKQPKGDPSLFDRFLDVSPVISGIIIVLIMLAVCANVIMRYFLNRPIVGIDEISEYLLLFITFIGSAWLLREEGHVGVDILLIRLSNKSNAFLGIFSSLIGIFICLILIWFGSKVVWINFQRGSYFPSLLEIPKAPVLAIIPLGSFLLLLQFLRRTARNVQEWRVFRNREADPDKT
jgi:TRAP-type C4-dicarboxylate transport system permease small subunit